MRLMAHCSMASCNESSRESSQQHSPGQEGSAATSKCWAKAETSNSQRVQWELCLIKA